MKYALVCGKRTEATKGIRAVCPNCGSELIAKCGIKKTKHWAHKSIRNCDPWWESETDWHRSWKNNYPMEWQESILRDNRTQEKHIADVNTIHGLVIEFQHSHIDHIERVARESFYKNMVWIIDGTRLRRDYQRFLKRKSEFRRTKKQGFFIVDFPHECFPNNWLGSQVPVIFDFKGTDSIDNLNDLRNFLYCLFPKQINGESILAIISRQAFINNTINGSWFSKQNVRQEFQTNAPKKRIFQKKIEPSHYYDPRKGRFVKRRYF